MPNSLNAISLAIGLLASSGHVDAGAWTGYVWNVASVKTCRTAAFCDLISMRWDWKRDQRVKLSAKITRSGIDLRLRLINNDPKDDDDVCVTALFRDGKNKVIAIFHDNSHSFPNTDESTLGRVSLSKSVLSAVTSVAVGAKQCRKGPHEDDAIYSSVKAAIGQQ